MKIAHIVSAFQNRVTGPRNSVTLMSRDLGSLPNVESKVFSDVTSEGFEFNGVYIYPMKDFFIDKPDIVVIAGVYNKNFIRIANYCLQKRIPYIVSPRSSLMRSSLWKSFTKKILFFILYGRNYILRSQTIHFLTEEEKKNSLFQKHPYFVCSNPLQTIAKDSCLDKKELIIGFLGRYDIHHKGLDILIKSVFKIKKTIRENGWRVKFHGADFKNGKNYLERKIIKLKLQDIVSIGGELHGSEKDSFLESVSIFIHASRYEGQPQAVMEAMSHGASIVVSPSTNLSEIVLKNSCGGVGVDYMGLALEMQKLILDDELRAKSSMNARAFSLNEFNSPTLASRFLDVLENLKKDK